MPAKKRRSPQEKKRLSYSRDRRNSYGENDKGSRKNISRKKRRRHRAARRRDHQLLARALGPVDTGTGDAGSQALAGERVMIPAHGKDSWGRKWPDEQLGHHVARALKRRADKDISAAATERVRIAKVLRNTAVDLATGYSMSIPGDS